MLFAPDSDLVPILKAISGGTRPADLESETLDFKEESRRSRSDTEKLLADAVLCLANHLGGTLVVGVKNDQVGPDAFVGAKSEIPRLRKRIFELTSPPLLVEVREITYVGERLLTIRVPEGVEVHADTQGRAPRRVHTDCVHMSPSEQMRLREERLGIDWSAATSSRPISDISVEAIRTAREHLGRVREGRMHLAEGSDEEVLRQLGVLSPNGRLTRAGEVLFCDRGPGHAARVVYLFRDTPGGEPRATERIVSSTLLAYGRVLELIAARRSETPIALPNGQQLTIEDFPRAAVEEAVANAVIHRDYYVDDPVIIDHSPQVLTVKSPGPLVSGVTPDNILTHHSKPRHPSLARAARNLRLAEEVGQGVDRMYREMIASGKQVPVIDSTTEVTVTFVGGAPNKRIASYVAALPGEERDDVDTLLTLLRLCARKTVDAADMVPRMQKGPDAAEAVLRRLASDEVGMLEPTRATFARAHPKYRFRDEPVRALGTAVRYNVRTTDEIDRKVIAHVREYGKITNKTVRNLLDVDVQRAKDVLVDLVSRGILTKTSEAQRGPSVEYGAGMDFPTPKRRVQSR